VSACICWRAVCIFPVCTALVDGIDRKVMMPSLQICATRSLLLSLFWRSSSYMHERAFVCTSSDLARLADIIICLSGRQEFIINLGTKKSAYICVQESQTSADLSSKGSTTTTNQFQNLVCNGTKHQHILLLGNWTSDMKSD